MVVKASAPSRLYRQVADRISVLITSGEFKVGDRLPAERDLCLALGVSRPSLREALIALEIEKIVQIRSGSGIYVLRESPLTEPDPAHSASLSPFDVIRARFYLEGEMAAEAARNATDQQLGHLSECLANLKRSPLDTPVIVVADRAFHLAIAQASGNSAYVLLLDTLWKHRTTPLYYQLEDHFLSAAVWQISKYEHEAIHTAIAARDPVAARAAMQAHIRNAENRMASRLD